MNSSPLLQAERLAASLVRGLRTELYLTPKPGLVDLLDSGSHPDLSLAKMTASIEQVADYFAELLGGLDAGADLPRLVGIGRRAEERMLATLGTNTHKGAIFLGGLLVVARFRTAASGTPMKPAVAAVAREVLTLSPPAATHGEAARRAFRSGGIVAEARGGLPSLFDVALPAWHRGRHLCRGDLSRAAFFMLSRLMQIVDDTTALHRCGTAGLARLQRDGRLLEAMMTEGFDPVPLLTTLNLEYRAMNLTMGGVADLLGVAFGVLDYEGWAVGGWMPEERELCTTADALSEPVGDQA